MNFKKYSQCLALVLFCLSSSLVISDSSVWLIEKEGKKLYLGGTLHLLSAEDFPLPSEYDQAYKQSDTLVFEADIRAANSAQGQAMALSAMMYKDGRTLETVLQPKTYQLLAAHFESKGMPIAMLNQFTVGGVSVTISLLEMQALGYTQGGVDQYYMQRAVTDAKPMLFLEKLEEQLAFVASLGEGQEDKMIEYSLLEIERLPTVLNQMKEDWRSGDMAGLEESAVSEMRELFPAVYESLLVERNRNWMPQIVQMMQTEVTELVLVGAAHLVGEDGLLGLLEAQGYKISKI